MLDMKFVRENPELVETMLKNRNNPLSLDTFLSLEKERRSVLSDVETLKSERNQESQEISQMKRAGENADVLAAGTAWEWAMALLAKARLDWPA